MRSVPTYNSTLRAGAYYFYYFLAPIIFSLPYPIAAAPGIQAISIVLGEMIVRDNMYMFREKSTRSGNYSQCYPFKNLGW